MWGLKAGGLKVRDPKAWGRRKERDLGKGPAWEKGLGNGPARVKGSEKGPAWARGLGKGPAWVSLRAQAIPPLGWEVSADSACLETGSVARPGDCQVPLGARVGLFLGGRTW